MKYSVLVTQQDRETVEEAAGGWGEGEREVEGRERGRGWEGDVYYVEQAIVHPQGRNISLFVGQWYCFELGHNSWCFSCVLLPQAL